MHPETSKTFDIVTSGRGMEPKGMKVGFIEADTKEKAEDNLIKSGQIAERFRGHFNFIEQRKVVGRCPSQRTEDFSSCGKYIPCDGVLYDNGEIQGGCAEPCSWIMHPEQYE